MEFLRTRMERLRSAYKKPQRSIQESRPITEIYEKDVPASRELSDPRIKRVQITDETIAALQRNDTTLLAEQMRTAITDANLTEDSLVFRGLMHPKENATLQLLSIHGTDRFVGYDSRAIPSPTEIDEVTPYRNTGETAALTADTYCVPDLPWSLAFTKLNDERSQVAFLDGENEVFLLAYDKAAVETQRTPPGGGEQWRTTFLTEPNEALALIIHIQPPDNSLH